MTHMPSCQTHTHTLTRTYERTSGAEDNLNWLDLLSISSSLCLCLPVCVCIIITSKVSIFTRFRLINLIERNRGRLFSLSLTLLVSFLSLSLSPPRSRLIYDHHTHTPPCLVVVVIANKEAQPLFELNRTLAAAADGADADKHVCGK